MQSQFSTSICICGLNLKKPSCTDSIPYWHPAYMSIYTPRTQNPLSDGYLPLLLQSRCLRSCIVHYARPILILLGSHNAIPQRKASDRFRYMSSTGSHTCGTGHVLPSCRCNGSSSCIGNKLPGSGSYDVRAWSRTYRLGLARCTTRYGAQVVSVGILPDQGTCSSLA